MENYKKCFAYNKDTKECRCLNDLYCKGNKNCHFYNENLSIAKIEEDVEKYLARKEGK